MFDKNEITVPNSSDWAFEYGTGDFTICGYWDKDENGKLISYVCSCKDYTKCKGFKHV